MQINNSFFDENQTRYQLVKSTDGNVIYNWLFLPGGPGIDSDYLLQLIDEIDVTGNCWLVDLLFSRSNASDNCSVSYQHWGDHFLTTIKKFENPILVGHSFGGYFPLLFPELENILKGFVILNSAPMVPKPSALNRDEFDKCAKKYNLPFGSETIKNFLANPTSNTLKEHYLSLVPYVFSSDHLVQGINVINNLSFNVDISYWWHTKGSNIYSTINWIPEKLPVLILSGNQDYLTPLSLFEQDPRFHRDNIELINILNAGHFPWIEQPIVIRDLLRSYSLDVVNFKAD